MKKLGTLFGADLMLDTKYDDVAHKAEKYLKEISSHHCETVEQAMDRMFGKPPKSRILKLFNWLFGNPTQIKAPRGKDANPLYESGNL